MKSLVFIAFLAVALTPAQPPSSGLDLRNLDPGIRPQDDLFRAANGGWLARTPVPPDRVTYGTFSNWRTRLKADLRAIIEGVAADRDRQRGTARQIADLYASLMDEARAEALGLRPIAELLRRMDAIRTLRDLATEAGYLSAIALGGPFLGTVEEDAERAGVPLVYDCSGRNAAAGSRLLPRGRMSGSSVSARSTSTTSRQSSRSPGRTERCGRMRAAVLALETRIARLQWTTGSAARSAARRRPSSRSERSSVRCRASIGASWARPQGIDRAGYVVFAQPSFFKGFAALVGSDGRRDITRDVESVAALSHC